MSPRASMLLQASANSLLGLHGKQSIHGNVQGKAVLVVRSLSSAGSRASTARNGSSCDQMSSMLSASLYSTPLPSLSLRTVSSVPSFPSGRPLVRCKVDSQPAHEAAKDVRVRFAPSPTGNLHVGGARTALFNWLFARANKGRFILRVEDTDLERSTKASEEAMLRDLKWLGLDWDEGPDNGGEYGPYRQSERNDIYRTYAEQLLKSGQVYRCFCTDEELDAMRAEQEAKKLPPKYMGKWATASEEEIEAELAKGTPFTYRFRVPENRIITIKDLIRGEVKWNTDTLGDFVVLRSNGQPVYNFCVAVDDATMRISHVIRAEEHLPNTLRQMLIYEALGLQVPQFGHVSLILAPDRSKLSKRHGATSVGQFKEMGYLSEAMVNYLALLGWNDGTEEEIFSPQSLIEKFSIDRVTKSAAIFDNTKLGWMNGQHLRKLSEEEVRGMIGEQWVRSGLMATIDGSAVAQAVALVHGGVEVVSEADATFSSLLSFPLDTTLASEEVKGVVEDGLEDILSAVLGAADSGELQAAVEGGHDTWQKWIKGVGKGLKRKGKRLFMPVRVLLTGKMAGPDVGSTLNLLLKFEEEGVLGEKGQSIFVPFGTRIQKLRELREKMGSQVEAESKVGASA